MLRKYWPLGAIAIGWILIALLLPASPVGRVVALMAGMIHLHYSFTRKSFPLLPLLTPWLILILQALMVFRG